MNVTPPVATAPGAAPALGHAVPLLRDPLRFLSSLPAHGDLVRIRVGPFAAVVVCDPDLTRRVLLDDRTFDKGGPVYDRVREVAGDGLASCPHSRHRRQRRLLQPSFHPARMPGYAREMTRQTEAVTGGWRDGGIVDVRTAMATITARTVVATMFTGRLSPAALHTVLEDFHTLILAISRRAVMPPPVDRLPTPGNRRYRRALARLRGTVQLLIAGHRADGTDHGDLLSTLVAARDEDADDRAHPGRLSDDEIADQLITFFMAGTDTTASTLAWALHLVSRHPETQERLQAEADAVLGGRAARLDDLPRLDLTGRVVQETLRLYPPGWLLSRTTTTDARLGGRLLPAGTTVLYSAYLLHHRPDLHPDPERFDPGRWPSAAEPGRPTPHERRGAFVPFGGGARKCIGEAFGFTEAVLTLASIAAAWRVEPVPGRPVRPVPGVTLRPGRLPLRTVGRGRGA
ncbi:cytochrome P450 [Streptomyces mashuensis]|nr:cytochrome P450 [Streptomyces mashuensis]